MASAGARAYVSRTGSRSRALAKVKRAKLPEAEDYAWPLRQKTTTTMQCHVFLLLANQITIKNFSPQK